MDTVSVTELNQQTARVLERVKSGESVEISEYRAADRPCHGPRRTGRNEPRWSSPA